MSYRQWIGRAAVVAAASICGSLMVSSAARAANGAWTDLDPEPAASPQFLAENAPSLAPGAPPSLNSNRAPLMSLLEKAGIAGALDRARINIYGHIEGSYNYNFDNPRKSLNLGRVFDINDNRFEMNQLDLNIERKVDPHQWDIGGRLEMFYGSDARFTTSSGFLGNSSSSSGSQSSSFSSGPEYQFDIPQINLDLSIPVGNGLRIRLGKFLFFKQIDPNASVFFSHSFTFGAALPFTLTGVTAYYPINDNLSVEGGFSRGWGQTFRDNNGAIDGIGRVRYHISDQSDFSLALITGPEQTHDNSHYRTVFDATLTYSVNDKLTLLFDGVYGYEAQTASVGDDQWYGLSAYAVYKTSDYANVNLRGEFYRDEEGYTTGIKQTLFEVTLGLTLTPFPDNVVGESLKIRPEIRFDYSTAGFFNGLTQHDQWVFAVDAYYDF